MLFQVTRTSKNETIKPHDSCFPIQLNKVEWTLFYRPEEYDETFADKRGKWFDNGTNHRKDKDGHIIRDMGMIDVWGIEINSIEELVAFREAVGEELILTTSPTDLVSPAIEIYDSYRE
jgi:hypothetical protein